MSEPLLIYYANLRNLLSAAAYEFQPGHSGTLDKPKSFDPIQKRNKQAFSGLHLHVNKRKSLFADFLAAESAAPHLLRYTKQAYGLFQRCGNPHLSFYLQ
jgi:hypothetical protein